MDNTNKIQKFLTPLKIEEFLEKNYSEARIYKDIKRKLSLEAPSYNKDVETIKSCLGGFLMKEGYPGAEELMGQANIDSSKFSPRKFDLKAWQGSGGKWLKSISVNLEHKEKELEFEQFRKSVIADIKKNSPKITKFKYRPNHDLMYLMGISDVHLGKVSVDPNETFANDKKRLYQAVDDLLSRVGDENISKIVFPLGNDLFNIDSKFETTTAGTPQSNCMRWSLLFNEARKIIIECIDKCLNIAPVEIICVAGNHDHHSSFSLSHVVDAWYHNNNNVNVDLEETERKYFQWGINMLGFTHGDKEKTDSLPNLMAVEEPLMWSETKYRIFYMGHLHKKSEKVFRSGDECAGVRVKILPSLSTTDEWHRSKGYIGNLKSAEGYLFSKRKGLLTTHETNFF